MTHPAAEPTRSITSTEGGAVLCAHDVRVSLGGLPILRGVSLEVGPREAVALLGGNGSGKSTFLRACLGLTPIHSGTVTWFGAPLPRFTQWRRIGYVPQRSQAGIRGATVGEIVATGRLSLRPPFVPGRGRDRAAVRQALQQVDLSDRAGQEFSTLSGGQQQRALIARALVAEPEVLVLDEPTAGVDLAHQQVLAETIRELMSQGLAMLVVLHELGPLRTLIGRAVTLRGGRVIAEDIVDGTGGSDHHHDRGQVERFLPGGLIGHPGGTHG